MTLPDTLHGLLELALRDFDSVAQDPAYKVNMRAWLRKAGGVCHVCLAGAVMAKTLKIAPSEDDHFLGLGYFDCPLGVASKLRALDYLRDGMLREASEQLLVRTDFPDYLVTLYDTDATQWREDMDALLAYLKEKNL